MQSNLMQSCVAANANILVQSQPVRGVSSSEKRRCRVCKAHADASTSGSSEAQQHQVQTLWRPSMLHARSTMLVLLPCSFLLQYIAADAKPTHSGIGCCVGLSMVSPAASLL